MRPKAWIATSATRSMSLPSATSAACHSTSAPCARSSAPMRASSSWLREHSTSFAPRFAASRAVASPIPLSAPVITIACSRRGFNATPILHPPLRLRPACPGLEEGCKRWAGAPQRNRLSRRGAANAEETAAAPVANLDPGKQRPTIEGMDLDQLSPFLGSEARARLLAHFVVHPESREHVRSLERHTGLGKRSLQVELARLETMGLVRREREGRRVLYVRSGYTPQWRAIESLVG